MKVVTMTANHGVEVRERAPLEPGPGEVRVAVRACGICGSDLHMLHAGAVPGHVPGHEIAGRIDACGEGVEGLAPGESVVVEPISSCGVCEACRSGHPIWCRQVKLYGVQLPGGMADEIVVPATRVHRVDAALDPAVAALVEPVAVGVHALHRAGLEPGERVLVLGAGAIGLLCAFAAKALGAREVWITARHAHQAEQARALGASLILPADDTDARTLDALGRRDDVDVVVETVGGAADTLPLASAAVRPGGRIAVAGLFTTQPSLDTWPLLIKEVSLLWSNCYASPTGEPPEFETAARLVEDERERLAALCTHSLPLQDASRAFQLAADKSSGAIKVTLTT
jgi:2-desacetyl-2-hydroxyethyl bacteriochlorophyllide A dehydrogenase